MECLDLGPSDIIKSRNASREPAPGAEARDTAQRSRPSGKAGQGAACQATQTLLPLLNLAQGSEDYCGPEASSQVEV